VVSRSSTESELQSNDKCELKLIWIKDLLTEIDSSPECLMRLYGDNKVAIHITENDVFHDRTQHIEVDCHIVRKKLEDKIVMAKHVSSGHQLADLLTKPFCKTRVDFIHDKLGMYDVYAPPCGGVLGNINCITSGVVLVYKLYLE